jgi:DNA mismatch endonuclease (patch repair protein)
MRSIESEGTGPEAEAEAALDALGVAYEAQPSYGRYRPDFRLPDGSVFQVMGCFWHGCPCQRGMDEVGANEDYWGPKLRDNMERDRRRRRELLSERGVPYVAWVWEHADVGRQVEWHCRRLGLAPDTPGRRFWSKVEKRGAGECWPWRAGTDSRGDGNYHRGGTSVRACREAYRLWFGRVPEGTGVVRSCGSAGCCNPGHLRAERSAYAGAGATGEDHGRSKLTEEQVRDIRGRYKEGPAGPSQEELAEEHGVSQAAVSLVLNGETWTGVGR